MIKERAEEYAVPTMRKHVPFQQASVLITGLIRDGEKHLEKEVETLYRAFENFKRVEFLIVESDSSDNIVHVLKELSKEIKGFEYVSLGNLSSQMPNRIDRIAFCRNKAHALISEKIASYDYIAVTDLDGVNHLLTQDAVQSCWSRSDWDVVTANQSGPYYDIYALRAEGWCEVNCEEEVRKLANSGIHPMKARKKEIYDRQKVIPISSNWVPVKSAFGGLAIYTSESFMFGSYSSRNRADLIECEHLSLNLAITVKGGRIFINPRLINSMGNDLSKISKRLKYLIKYTLSFVAPKLFMRWIG